jgi:iron(III) transport system permease protein
MHHSGSSARFYRHTFGALFLLGIASVTVAPVVYVVVSSFDVAPLGAAFHFGLDGWHDVFTSARTWSAIFYTFVLAIRVPIATVIAFAVAWLLIRVEIPGHRFIELAFWFGFLLPVFPMMMGWILLLDSHYGLVNLWLMKLPFVHGPIFSIYSVPGILWVHLVLTTIPIMVILLGPTLRQLDASFEEAADMSGAGTMTTLRRITIPLLLPAIATAFVLALIKSLEAFEIERVLGTPVNVNVYSTRIYDFISLEPPLFPQAMALGTIFLAILLFLAILYQAYLDRAGTRPTISGRGVRLQGRPETWWAYAVSIVLVGYIAVTILLPLVVLILGSFNKLFGFFFIDHPWTVAHWTSVLHDTRFLRATVTSVTLGLSVGLVGVLVFSLIAWVLVRAQIWGLRLAALMVWLPWAIPGLILGVTLLGLILQTPGLSVLYGTIVPLLLALIIKELPIGVQLLRGSIAQISGQLEEAAVMCGAGFGMIFRRVTLPLIAPMLASVFLLVFASTLRDVSTVVLIATPGTRTMALLMFDFTLSGQLEAASVVGVIIALICVAVTAASFKIGNKIGIQR